MGVFREQFEHVLDSLCVFSVNNACKTDFLIGVFHEQFNSLFKREKALFSQDDSVFNQVFNVYTVVILFDSTKMTQCSTKTKMCAPCTVMVQDTDVCTVVI